MTNDVTTRRRVHPRVGGETRQRHCLDQRSGVHPRVGGETRHAGRMDAPMPCRVHPRVGGETIIVTIGPSSRVRYPGAWVHPRVGGETDEQLR